MSHNTHRPYCRTWGDQHTCPSTFILHCNYKWRLFYLSKYIGSSWSQGHGYAVVLKETPEQPLANCQFHPVITPKKMAHAHVQDDQTGAEDIAYEALLQAIHLSLECASWKVLRQIDTVVLWCFTQKTWRRTPSTYALSSIKDTSHLRAVQPAELHVTIRASLDFEFVDRSPGKIVDLDSWVSKTVQDGFSLSR